MYRASPNRSASQNHARIILEPGVSKRRKCRDCTQKMWQDICPDCVKKWRARRGLAAAYLEDYDARPTTI